MFRTARHLLCAVLMALGLLSFVALPAHAATYTITGKVTGLDAAGNVIPLVDVNLWAYVKDDWQADPSYGSSGADGTYTITLPASGVFELFASCSSGSSCKETHDDEWFENSTQGEATPITVADGVPAVANVRLDRYATVKGRVTDQAGNPVTTPLEVAANFWGGGSTNPAEVRPDANGYYTINKVRPGLNGISVRDVSGEHIYADQTFGGGSTTVPPGPAVTTANFTLAPATGIVGTATDLDGKPLPNVLWNVLEYRPAENDWYGIQMGPLLTDANGEMWWPTQVGKTYKLCFSDEYYDYWGSDAWNPTYRYRNTCWENSTTAEGATVITPTEANRRQELTVKLPVEGLSLNPEIPFVYGPVQAGSTLRVDTGSWAPADVALTYAWTTWADGQRTVLATTPTYTPTSAQQGLDISVQITGTKAGYKTATMHAWGGTVGKATPTLASPLTITGNPVAGSTLTASHGAITPDEYASYTWLVDGVVVADQSGNTFPLTAAYAGKQVSVRMQSYGGGELGDLHAYAAGPVVLGALTAPTPTITGTKTVGQTLTANPGTWGPAPVTLAYQWFRSGTAITGATAATYALTTADQAKTMTVRVTGTKAGYQTVAKTSAATTAVRGALTAPTPTISGTKTVGYTLTANPGTWGPAPVTLAYQWFRSGTAITGATAATYKLTSTDQAKTITVRVTGTKAGYQTVAKTSAATTAVLGALTTATPTITGTRKVGYTLTANPGAWGPATVTFVYQWYRNGVAISGATLRTYKLVTADRGQGIKVRVTGSKAGYMSVAKYSALAGTIS